MIKIDECSDIELLRSELERVLNLLDDVDSASDLAEEDDELYRALIYNQTENIFGDNIASDGNNWLINA